MELLSLVHWMEPRKGLQMESSWVLLTEQQMESYWVPLTEY
jgi:hypothetical protein